MSTDPPTATDVDLSVSPYEHVRAQLARQKWAVDTRDADALDDLYTTDCELIIHAGSPVGATEINRLRGRAEIIAFMVAGWARTADTWYPGSSIHHIGTQLIEPAPGGRLRCRSYALYVHLRDETTTELHGYGTYDDLWEPEDGTWRMARRSLVIHGRTIAMPKDPTT